MTDTETTRQLVTEFWSAIQAKDWTAVGGLVLAARWPKALDSLVARLGATILGADLTDAAILGHPVRRRACSA